MPHFPIRIFILSPIRYSIVYYKIAIVIFKSNECENYVQLRHEKKIGIGSSDSLYGAAEI